MRRICSRRPNSIPRMHSGGATVRPDLIGSYRKTLRSCCFDFNFIRLELRMTVRTSLLAKQQSHDVQMPCAELCGISFLANISSFFPYDCKSGQSLKIKITFWKLQQTAGGNSEGTRPAFEDHQNRYVWSKLEPSINSLLWYLIHASLLYQA